MTMRRTKLAALMIISLLLSGCGGHGNEKKFEGFRTALSAAQEIGMTAEVTADYGDTAREYTLALTDTAEGSQVEVLAPALLAGVRAHIDKDGSTLEYENLILDTGELTDDGLTPVSALPRLVETIRTGHVDGIWREGECLAVKLTPDDTVTLTLWLDAETMTPRRAELSGQDDGRMLVSCIITEFKYA